MDGKLGRSIRSKILLAYGAIVLIIVLLTVWSIYNFARLRLALTNVLKENYLSVVAAESMVAALERQDSGVLLYVAGERDIGHSIVSQSQPTFLVWYARAVDNITIPGEKDILVNINEEYKRYSEGYLMLREVLASQGQDAARAYYLKEMLPTFTRIRELCANLQAINQEYMMSGERLAAREARRAEISVAVFSGMAMVLALVFGAWTVTSVVGPIKRFKELISDIAEGRLDEDVPVTRDDEIGALALEFRRMVEALKARDMKTIQEFSKERTKLAGVVNGMSDGIVVTDAGFAIELVNPVAEAIIGVDEEQAVGRHILEVLDDEEVFEAIKSAAEGRKGHTRRTVIEVTSKRQGREQRAYYSVHAAPIREKGGALAGVVVVFSDVTRYKEVDELKSKFVSTVSHEFRTPLTSITMSVGLLLEDERIAGDEKTKELLDIIKEDAERLTKLVNQLLDLSRIEAGKIELRKIPVKVKELFEEAVKPLLGQLAVQDVGLEYDVDESLMVRVDPDKIVWVISNLVGNALRYSPRGSIIRVGAKADDGNVRVYVADEGPGIPKEYHEKIFQRFVQVKTSGVTGVRGGAGLGLAIAREIVEAHDGVIWVESEPGRGATFIFTVPRYVRETGLADGFEPVGEAEDDADER